MIACWSVVPSTAIAAWPSARQTVARPAAFFRARHWSISPHFDRSRRLGRPLGRDDEASITIKLEGAALTVSGQATWGAHDPERVKRGGVNTGDIDTVATPRGSLIAIGSGYDGANSPDISNVDDCRARLRLFGPYLAVEDNTACGGMNVTFAGVYSRQP